MVKGSCIDRSCRRCYASLTDALWLSAVESPVGVTCCSLSCQLPTLLSCPTWLLLLLLLLVVRRWRLLHGELLPRCAALVQLASSHSLLSVPQCNLSIGCQVHLACGHNVGSRKLHVAMPHSVQTAARMTLQWLCITGTPQLKSPSNKPPHGSMLDPQCRYEATLLTVWPPLSM
jgi:hypothetical protein